MALAFAGSAAAVGNQLATTTLGLLPTVVTVLGVLVGALTTRLLVDEAVAGLGGLTDRITSTAAGLVPYEHRERYRAEWTAELETLKDRKLSALVVALRILARSVLVRREVRGSTPASAELRPEPTPPARVSSSLTLLEASEPARQFMVALLERTRPLYWDDIREEMGDPGEHDFSVELAAATRRFEWLTRRSGPPLE